jgi:hypothetical protein
MIFTPHNIGNIYYFLLLIKQKGTADSMNDETVVDAVAGAAFSIGAKPMVVWIPAPGDVGKAGDNYAYC